MTSSRPKRSTAARTASSTDSRLATSHRTASASPFFSATIAAVCSTVSLFTSAATTLAPCSANNTHAARPTPEPAPVTSTTFPSTNPFIVLSAQIQTGDLLIQPNTFDAALAPDAAEPLAAGRGVGTEYAGVDLHRATLYPGGDVQCLASILTVHITGQTEAGVVGHRHRVIQVAIADHRDHRSEDFILRRRVVVIRQIEHRGFKEITALQVIRAPATGHHPTTLFQRRRHKSFAALDG